MKYNIDEIRQAFWDTFHESGECWFDYIGTEASNFAVTNDYWEMFLENLNNQKEYNGRP